MALPAAASIYLPDKATVLSSTEKSSNNVFVVLFIKCCFLLLSSLMVILIFSDGRFLFWEENIKIWKCPGMFGIISPISSPDPPLTAWVGILIYPCLKIVNISYLSYFRVIFIPLNSLLQCSNLWYTYLLLDNTYPCLELPLQSYLVPRGPILYKY